jgi:hypothetical protein
VVKKAFSQKATKVTKRLGLAHIKLPAGPAFAFDHGNPAALRYLMFKKTGYGFCHEVCGIQRTRMITRTIRATVRESYPRSSAVKKIRVRFNH